MFKNNRKLKFGTKNKKNGKFSSNINRKNIKLKAGDSGKNVLELQEKIKEIKKYYPTIPEIKLSGTYDDNTIKCVKRFQELFGIYDTGLTDIITLNKVNDIYNKKKNYVNINKKEENIKRGDKNFNNIKEGSRGEKVIELQENINKVSNLFPVVKKVKIDGVFGEDTKNSVLTFQRLSNIKDDGIVKKDTWDKLYNTSLGKKTL